jgi:phosphocarrier protein
MPQGMKVQVRQVCVTHPYGIHARVAARIVLLASRFKCRVQLAVKGRTADARNIIAVLLLAAAVGSEIRIETSGVDESEALDALSALIGSKHEL